MSNLLINYIRLLLSEGSSLTASELAKRPERFEIFLSMMKNKQPFLTKDGEVTISARDNPDLVAALQATEDEWHQAYNAAFAAGVKTSAGIITSPKELLKSKEFGGFAGRQRESDANESLFSDAINRYAKKRPITVFLGKKKITGVTGASRTGADRVDGEVSKADVILHTKRGDVKISIKMKTADYYLSGDAKLAPVVGPIVSKLLKAKAPKPRVRKEGNSYLLVAGSGNGAPVNISFDISPELAQIAVFGSGENTVDIIVKGDLSAQPEHLGKDAYSWPVSVYTTVKDLPESDQPIGLLRVGEAGRGFTYEGVKFSGIRPAIATQKRTRSALKI